MPTRFSGRWPIGQIRSRTCMWRPPGRAAMDQKPGRGAAEATLCSDATLKHPAPPLALPGREFMERARAIWDELQLPTLSPQPPWHGYSLGDWSDAWDVFARRAVAGDWETSGKETYARRRGGVTPE